MQLMASGMALEAFHLEVVGVGAEDCILQSLKSVITRE